MATTNDVFISNGALQGIVYPSQVNYTKQATPHKKNKASKMLISLNLTFYFNNKQNII